MLGGGVEKQKGNLPPEFEVGLCGSSEELGVGIQTESDHLTDDFSCTEKYTTGFHWEI